MLRIDNTEQTVRMQTDLRLGLPIVITKEKDNFLIFSTERISKIHFSILMLTTMQIRVCMVITIRYL